MLKEIIFLCFDKSHVSFILEHTVHTRQQVQGLKTSTQTHRKLGKGRGRNGKKWEEMESKEKEMNAMESHGTGKKETNAM